MQCRVEEKVKKLAEVKVEDSVSIEEIQAIKDILIRAGLMVETEDRNIFILSKA